MATLSVRFPESVHNAVKELAKKDNVSINQFVTSAVMEKIAALETERYIEERAKRGNREAYDAVLKKVPHSAPGEDDI